MPSLYCILTSKDEPYEAPRAQAYHMAELCTLNVPGGRHVMFIDGDNQKRVILHECDRVSGWQPYSPVLGPQQKAAYDFIMDGGTCLVTGPGGTGKSELIRRVIRDLRANGQKVAITASTGVAAVNLSGMTIHATLGTGLSGNRREAQGRYSNTSAERAYDRLVDVSCIIVDEVSMLTGDYIDMMDWWLRLILSNDQPFGGKQVVFLGDFCQLPPVSRGSDVVHRRYAFQADIWQFIDPVVFYLRKGYRQDDAEFRKHLMRIRRGMFPDDTAEYFNRRRDAEFPPGAMPTRLCALNREVDRINTTEFNKLTTSVSSYEANYTGHPNWIEALRKTQCCEDTLDLRVGAEVMVTKNIWDEGLFNGLRGVVVKLDGSVIIRSRDGVDRPINRTVWELKDANERVVASVNQLPLRLAWALTIHKSQGSTLDDLELDPASIFDDGQCYVALSRVRSINGLRLKSRLIEQHVRADPVVVQWYADVVSREANSAASVSV